MSDEGASGGAASDGDERPLKKARYQWQIKDGSAAQYSNRKNFGNFCRLKEAEGHSFPISHRKNSCDGIGGRYHVQRPPPPRLDCGAGSRFDCADGSRVQCSDAHGLLEPDRTVFRYQTSQMAKAIVDNTINKVLEDMGFIPLLHDVEELINQQQSGGSGANVEDSAVLMAIRSHGLHQKPPCSCSHPLPPSSLNQRHQHRLPPFHHRPTTDDFVSEPLRFFSTSSSPQLPPQRPFEDSSPSTPSRVEYVQCEAAEDLISHQHSQMETGRAVQFEHDFLAQAVSVAIHKKGLGATDLADSV